MKMPFPSQQPRHGPLGEHTWGAIPGERARWPGRCVAVTSVQEANRGIPDDLSLCFTGGCFSDRVSAEAVFWPLHPAYIIAGSLQRTLRDQGSVALGSPASAASSRRGCSDPPMCLTF